MADRFWSAVKAYVTDCLKSLRSSNRDDLLDDVLIELLARIDTVRLRLTFSKWLNGLIHNMRVDRYRTDLRNERVSVSYSQSVIKDQDGMEYESEPSYELYPWDESDLTAEYRAAGAAIALDAIRASLNKRDDVELLDLLRSGLTLSQVATRKGITYAAAQRRFARLKTKLTKIV
jgi:RNA polymerase sigma factor (sigma-70 family)